MAGRYASFPSWELRDASKLGNSKSMTVPAGAFVLLLFSSAVTMSVP